MYTKAPRLNGSSTSICHALFVIYLKYLKFPELLLKSFLINANLILQKKKNKKPKEGSAATTKELSPPPDFIAERLALWDKLKKEQDEKIAAKPQEPIVITLPDGKQIEGQSWKTTPYEVALGISKGLADNAVISKVDGVLWDLDRPFEKSSSLALIKFDDEEGQAVFWHSSAHILGEAMERVYGGHLCYGPPIENGFYYDMYSEDYRVI